LSFPTQRHPRAPIGWAAPTYTVIHHVLSNPVYAGAYTYGKTRRERFVDEHGNIQRRIRHLPREQWSVLIKEHHAGYIDWSTYEANQARLGSNTRPQAHQGGGAVREGAALLQGLATCGHCGRKLHTHYRGKNQAPGYHCSNKSIVDGRGVYCLSVGGVQIDEAVTNAFLGAVQPAGLAASLRAAELLQADHDGALAQWRLAVERAEYEVQRAERRYRAVDPDNRLVARGLETQWEKSLRALEQARSELTRREQLRPQQLTHEQREHVLALGRDLQRLWNAPSTSLRDKKELLRTLLEEVGVSVYREQYRALLKLRWRGGLLTECDVSLPRSRPATVRTDEDTIGLVRRLALHHDDAMIASILNRQERTTAYGLRFTQNLVGNLRRHWGIPRFEPPAHPAAGDLLSIQQAAKTLGIAASTLHRWINDGFIAGEQVTPGAPWRIRVNDALRRRLVEDAPSGLCRHDRGDQATGRDETDGVAACQARRARRRARVLRPQKRLENQSLG
jgi:Recombinase/Recombinase zinc beta ribbon domain